jgi:flagellar hook assembly protein FlgD
VEVFNVLGQKVKTVYSGNLQSGAHQFTWSGDNEAGAAVPGGIYYAVLTAGSIRNTVKMVLLK